MTKTVADSSQPMNRERMLHAALRLDQAITSCQASAGCDGRLILEARYLVAAMIFAVSQSDEIL